MKMQKNNLQQKNKAFNKPLKLKALKSNRQKMLYLKMYKKWKNIKR